MAHSRIGLVKSCYNVNLGQACWAFHSVCIDQGVQEGLSSVEQPHNLRRKRFGRVPTCEAWTMISYGAVSPIPALVRSSRWLTRLRCASRHQLEFGARRSNSTVLLMVVRRRLALGLFRDTCRIGCQLGHEGQIAFSMK